jgi:putative ATP-binding cassette transporter
MAFAQVLGALSLIVTQFETLSTFAAVTDRLNTIAGAIEQARVPAPSAIEIVPDADRLAYEGLTLWTPKERHTLVRDLSLALPQGRCLLITGPNDAAKEALFVATAGFWEDGEGRISRPPRDQFEFVLHHPFTTCCTLRDRLLITMPDRTVPDEQLIAALHQIGLGAALERIGGLDVAHERADDLAPAEQQLIAAARLLLSRPRFAMLRQVADDLAPDQIEQLYRALSEASITYVSIAENHQLQSYHDAVLELRDGGRWEWAGSPVHEARTGPHPPEAASHPLSDPPTP